MPNENHIDVVADFVYDSQNAQYNTDYRHWRKKTDAPYVYRYSGNPKESVYVEGKGITKRTVTGAERSALTHVSEILGVAFLAYLVCELAGGSAFVWILQKFGLNVHLDFLTFSMGGSQWTVMLVRSIAALIKYLTAYLILYHGFRMPAKIRIPIFVGGLPEYILAAGLGMGAACVFCLVDAVSGQGAHTAEILFSYKEAAAMMAYALFDVIVFSVLSEALLRGIVLPALRQFGDLFAICVLAGAAFLFPNTFSTRVGEFFVSAAACFIMLKSGSLGKCILLRAVYSAVCYSRLVLVYDDKSQMSIGRFLLILTLSFVFCGAFYWLTRPKNRLLSNRQSYLPAGRKLLVFSATVTMLPWLCLSALIIMVQMFF